MTDSAIIWERAPQACLSTDSTKYELEKQHSCPLTEKYNTYTKPEKATLLEQVYIDEGEVLGLFNHWAHTHTVIIQA